jgi:hypothetical protein
VRWCGEATVMLPWPRAAVGGGGRRGRSRGRHVTEEEEESGKENDRAEADDEKLMRER